MRHLDGLSRGDLLRLAEQQGALLAELVASRERDRAEITTVRAASARAQAELVELRAAREEQQRELVELRATNEELRTRVRELEEKPGGGSHRMPGLKPGKNAPRAAGKPRQRRAQGVWPGTEHADPGAGLS